eukprot:3131365-Prymnesium_polylepis.1
MSAPRKVTSVTLASTKDEGTWARASGLKKSLQVCVTASQGCRERHRTARAGPGRAWCSPSASRCGRAVPPPRAPPQSCP